MNKNYNMFLNEFAVLNPVNRGDFYLVISGQIREENDYKFTPSREQVMLRLWTLYVKHDGCFLKMFIELPPLARCYQALLHSA